MKNPVQAKKHLGQHFLVDLNIAHKIVDALSGTTHPVLEVGPGTGILTHLLLKRNFSHFVAIDLDIESIEFLKNQFPAHQENFLYADFLKYDLKKLFGEEDFNIIGNFPYNISGPILFKVLDYCDHIEEVVGMFQKEVVERIVSVPGNKQYGILSVLLQAYFEVEMLFTVSNKVFVPPPKVQSAVLRLRRKKKAPEVDFPLFKDVVKTAFNQRRKTLKNALKKFNFPNTIDVNNMMLLRAERLSFEDFIFLSNSIISIRDKHRK
jgi:16S rRNA (adenine1518-N6/adenine1519-N6)-dimethyltransferase